VLDPRRIALRKGRCSNDPKNCTLAENKTEIPYAGMDSVCPECGSPLAAIAFRAPPPPPIAQAVAPDYTQTQTPSYAQDDVSRYDERRAARDQHPTNARDDYSSDEPRPNDSVMKLTQLVIVGAAIALLGFFAWRMFLQPRPVSAPDLAATASVSGVGDQQVMPISPAQLRRVTVTTQALSIPAASGTIISQLPAGSVLDVSGQVQVDGITWLRVSLPNDSSKSGFVRADQLSSLGDGDLAITPVDQLPSSTLPSAAPTQAARPETVGPIQARPPATFYIASLQANIRQEANASSVKVGAFEFTDPITVIGQRSVGASIWYQVQLPSGGNGWINGRLVSSTPRATPLDRESATPSASVVKVPTRPENSSDQPTEDVSTLDSKPALSAVAPGTTMRVDSSVANLRKEPGVTGNSVVEVLQRDTLMSVEDVRILSGVPWYKVTSPNGAQGWISGRTLVENK
jgi:uncharacterized protein YgiM (DUF1202 family)